MRIAHVTDTYLPRLGGIEGHVADLAAHQAGQGHDVYVITGVSGAPGPTAEVGGVTVLRAPATRLGTVARAAVGPAWAWHVVATRAFDVVHCHVSITSPLAFAFAAAGSNAGLPTAVTVHSMWPPFGPLLSWSTSLAGLRRRKVAWSAVSEVAARPVRRALGAEVTVLPNAVDVEWWRRRPRRPSPTSVVVISVSRLASRKRPMPLLRIMAEVRRRVPESIDVRLVLVGDGPQRRAIERHVQRAGMSSWVHLAGRLDRHSVRDLLSIGDVYVAPADLESFGIAALEARSAGLPIVAKRGGGVGDFVRSGTEGLLADRDSDMVRCIAELVASAELREQMAQHNRAHPPSLGWDGALARTAELYGRAEQLCGSAAQGPVTRGLDLTSPEPVQ